MILRAIGYVDSALKGNWPTNFKVKAIDLDLLDDVNMATAAADRGGVAQILFNALELDMMELGEENVLVKAGRLFIDNIATPDTIDVNPNHVNPDHKDYAGDVVDLAPYMYQNLDVYLNDNDEVVYIKGSNSIVITGTVDSVTTGSTFVVKDANAKKHTIDFDYAIDTLPMFYNGAEIEFKVEEFDADEIVSKDFEKITVVGFEEEDKDNNKIDRADELIGLVVREQTAAKKIANVYKDGRTKLDGIELAVDDGDVDLDNVIVKGAVDAIEDIEKDDVVVSYLAKDKSKVELVVSRDTVEGRVTRTDKTSYAYISGKEYKINKASGYTAKLGEKGVFFLDHNGKIVASKTTKAEPTDYAIIINSATGTAIAGRFGGEYEVDEYPVIKLATQDNEVVVYDVFVEVKDNGDVDESATYIINDDLDPEEFDLVVTGSALGSDIALNFASEATLDEGTLVKYILNDDGQIETIEFVDFETLSDVDTTKSTFKLAEGAVIFDARDDEDYAVVKESMLKDTIAGSFVYNDDGELEVIVTVDIKDDADDAVYAWVEDIEYAYNDDDDKVQVATVYMDGEEEELYTDDDDVFKVAGPGVFKLELDGNVITKATLQSPVSKTVSAVSTKNNMVQFKDSAAWFAIADNATMITLDDGEFDEFVDIFDVAEGDTLKYVLNTDEDIAYFQLIIEK